MNVSLSERQPKRPPRHSHFGPAWVALCAAFPLHVTDEALTDFLSVYNPTVIAIRERLPFLPLPTFRFDSWLTLLIVALIGLFALTPLAFRGKRGLVPFARFYSVVMLLNGILHIVGSFYLGRFMPGVYSSPFLLAASVYLWISLPSRARRIPA